MELGFIYFHRKDSHFVMINRHRRAVRKTIILDWGSSNPVLVTHQSFPRKENQAQRNGDLPEVTQLESGRALVETSSLDTQVSDTSMTACSFYCGGGRMCTSLCALVCVCVNNYLAFFSKLIISSATWKYHFLYHPFKEHVQPTAL